MQTKLQSLLEVVTNGVSGFIIGIFINIFILGTLGYSINIAEGMYISLMFKLIGMTRSFLIRRLFNKINKGTT